jgi:hypothetical protein
VKDRSGTVIAAVAIGIAALGLAALVRILGKRWKSRRRFGRNDVARWLRRGSESARPLLLAFLVFVAMSVAGDLVRIHTWMKANLVAGNVSHAPPPSFPERVREAADLRGLPHALLGAWWKLVPFPWNWPLGFIPILLLAAVRRRFPFSSTGAVARSWFGLGTFFLIGWLYAFLSNSMPTAAPSFALAGALSLLYVLVGQPAFLMLLIGNVDPSAERRLARGAATARETLLRLAALAVAVAVAGVDGSVFRYAQRVQQWNLPAALTSAAGPSWDAVRLLLGAFAATAILPACSSSEPGIGFLRETWRWWKRDGLYLLTMPAAVTLAVWALTLPIEVPLVGWRSPSTAVGILRSDLHVVWGSLVGFAVNLLVFLLLLGNWLEAREELAARDGDA